MIGLALSLVAVGLLTAFDVWFSKRRIRKYGLQIELNRGLALLSKFIGVDAAVIVTLGLPWTLAIGSVAVWGSVVAAAFLLGFRTNMTVLQVLSLKTEGQIDKLLKSRPQ